MNVTWTNTDDCGSFSGFGAGATWDWGAGVGASPCTSSLPSGTITVTASAGGTVLASCTDTSGAETYGSIAVSNSLAECTTDGTGVSINSFFAQAVNASGNPIAAPSGSNYDWIIAVVVIILLLLILFIWWKRKKGPVAAMQAASAAPASAARFCQSCGAPVEPGTAFCPKCGKAL
ncbi:MAG: zinc ribbon domain-containing protein [Thaumarchaeota archaeon]|nr:zinc ribbon domain-containing protein [Nitrososphaerota archaeon]